MRRPLVGALIAALVVVVAVALVLSRDDSDRPEVIAPKRVGPFRGGRLPPGLDGRRALDFRLEDARGEQIDTRALRGRPYALTFLYTSCRDVCPLIGQELGRALELLGKDGTRVAALAVTVDPRGDTPRAAREWLRRHRLPPQLHYLLGSRQRLRRVWRHYFVAPQPALEAESRHTASIWLVDGRNRLRTKFSGGAPVAPRDLAHDLGLLVREQRHGAAARSSRQAG